MAAAHNPITRALRLMRTRPDAPALRDEREVERLYKRARWTTFSAITLGYAFFYTTRLTLSVAKKPMIDAGVVGADELGFIGSALLLSYAVGKMVNGFLADRAHIGRFMGVGLLCSALLNIAFGMSTSLVLFVVLWGVNGWFQSMGCAPSVVNMSHWFSNRERGTRYGIWATAHNLGEGVTFAGTALVAASMGWRMAFWVPGVVCVFAALAVMKFVYDRPSTYGLPTIADYNNDHGEAASTDAEASTWQMQLLVLKNPYVWILGLASASLYVSRYGVSNWMVLYLQEAKGYSLIDAGMTLSVLPVLGFVGTAASGTISDYFFKSRRGPVTLAYAVVLVCSLVSVHLIPAGHPWLDRAALCGVGFGTGGMLVFLGGLTAVDICPKRATGAAMGFIGLFSYVGAGVQDTISGVLIEASRTEVGGVSTYDFNPVFYFWIGAAVLALILSATLWNVKSAD